MALSFWIAPHMLCLPWGGGRADGCSLHYLLKISCFGLIWTPLKNPIMWLNANVNSGVIKWSLSTGGPQLSLQCPSFPPRLLLWLLLPERPERRRAARGALSSALGLRGGGLNTAGLTGIGGHQKHCSWMCFISKVSVEKSCWKILCRNNCRQVCAVQGRFWGVLVLREPGLQLGASVQSVP